MNEIKFSIIIPAYNCEDTLIKSVESVALQNYPYKEIIVINDGSTDGTYAVAKELASKHDCVKVLTHENVGVSATRNRGIDEATGDYIMFVDADDWMHEDALQLLAEHINRDKQDIIYFDYVFRIDSKDARMSLGKFKKGRFYTDLDNKYILHHIYDCINGNFNFVGITVWSGCYSSLFLRYTHLSFNANIAMNEGAMFNLNALRQTKKIAYLSIPLYTYYYDGAFSATKSCPCDIVEKHIIGVKALADFAERYYPDDEYIRKMLLSWEWIYICRIVWLSVQHATLEKMIDNMHKIEHSSILCKPFEYRLPPGNNKYNPFYIILFWAIKHKKYKFIYKRLHRD